VKLTLNMKQINISANFKACFPSVKYLEVEYTRNVGEGWRNASRFPWRRQLKTLTLRTAEELLRGFEIFSILQFESKRFHFK